MSSSFRGACSLNDDDDESSLDEASTTAAQKQREDEEELRSIMFPGGKPLELPLTEFEARCLRELKSYKCACCFAPLGPGGAALQAAHTTQTPSMLPLRRRSHFGVAD